MGFFKRYEFLSVICGIFLILIVSYGQIIFLDLWQDDNALVFKVLHPVEAAGVFGSGVLGQGAYRYVATPYILLSKIFGINLTLFYLLILFFYFLACVSVYFLAKKISNDGLVAALASFVFAAGYIGSDGILRLFNGIQTSYSIMFTCLTFIFLYRFYELKKISNYFVAVILFFITLETGYVRVQYLIGPIILFLLFNTVRFKDFKSLVKTLMLTLPFGAIYYQIYLKNPDPRSVLLKTYISGIFSGQFDFLHSFFATIGNIFIPVYFLNLLFMISQKITLNVENQLVLIELLFTVVSAGFMASILKGNKKIYSLTISLALLIWFILQWIYFIGADNLIGQLSEVYSVNILANFFGGVILIILATFIFMLKRDFRKSGFLLLVGILVFTVLSYSVYLPFSPFETIHRYITHSLIAFSILTPLVFNITLERFNNKRKKILLIGLTSLVIIVQSALAFNYQRNFVKETSLPTKKFFNQLKSYVPKFEKGDLIYFSVANDVFSKKQFSNFFSVGSMPNTTAIAIRYGIDRYDVDMATSYEEFLGIYKSKSISIGKVYSFFYSAQGLVDTTEDFRKGLVSPQKVGLNLEDVKYSPPKEISSGLNLTSLSSIGENSQVFLSQMAELNAGNFASTQPVVFDLNIKVNSLLGQINKFPVKDLTQGYRGEEVKYFMLKQDFSCDDLIGERKKLITGYLSSKQKVSKNILVETSTEEKGFGSGYLVDGDRTTLWRANRGGWNLEKKAVITLDLNQELLISRLDFVNGYSNSTPVAYLIETSLDSKTWEKVSLVSNRGRKNNGELITEKFGPVKVRFVRLTFLKTLDDDAPAVSEITVYEKGFEDLRVSEIESFENSPMNCVYSLKDVNDIDSYVNTVGVRFYVAWKYKSEKIWQPDNIKVLQLVADGLFHRYQVVIPSGGIMLERIKIGPANVPSVIEVSDGFLVSLKP